MLNMTFSVDHEFSRVATNKRILDFKITIYWQRDARGFLRLCKEHHFFQSIAMT